MKKRKLQSWRAIAKEFYEAFKRCDWSLGRVQDAKVHDFLDVAELDYRDKLEVEERARKQKRRTSDRSKS